MQSYLVRLHGLLDAAIMAARAHQPDANDRQFEARDYGDGNVPEVADETTRKAIEKITHAIALAQYPLHEGRWDVALVFLEHAESLLTRLETGDVDYVASLHYRGIYFGGPRDGETWDMAHGLEHGVGAPGWFGCYDVSAHDRDGDFRMAFRPHGSGHPAQEKP